LNNLTASTSQNESLMHASKSMNLTNGLDQQRLSQIQNIQKQIELQQHNSFSKSAGTFQSNIDHEWLMMNMLNNNQFKNQALNQFNDPNDLPPTDDWLINHAKQQQQLEAKSSFQQRSSLSPQTSSVQASNPWLNNGTSNLLALPQQNQPKYNFQSQPSASINQGRNQNSFLNSNIQKQSIRSNSPLMLDNNLMLTNASNSLQQHQLFLQQQHQNLNASRCQTPSMQQQQQFSNFLNSTKLQNSDILSLNGVTSSISTSNQLVVNGLDEYLPFGANTTSMAQNFNHLSKMITNQTTTALPEISSLNMNLNELGLAVNHNGFPTAISDMNSTSSQSPTPALGPIGSNLNSNQFSGNGNLNPPVRQNCKMQNMQIRNKFGQLGAGKAQFNSPHGFCLGIDEEIIVADTNNHRIVIFDKNGDLKYAFGSPGREEGQLWYPRKVTVMRDSGKFVICDRGSERSRMQIFNKNGHFVKKISIRYIDIVAGLAITQDGEIVAVDSVSPTVFRINESGDLSRWFDCSDHMREPSDIAISGSEYFVCDFKGHCVVVFSDEGTFMRRIGGENITNFPNGIDVSDAGDVLVGDSHGNRFHIAVFSREGVMLSEFECPYVKVSRCCGLKITSEGYVVTLAKNNHHVLVLNTLYVA
jgi:hypothetical protein